MHRALTLLASLQGAEPSSLQFCVRLAILKSRRHNFLGNYRPKMKLGSENNSLGLQLVVHFVIAEIQTKDGG
jgi:hypothetical protein